MSDHRWFRDAVATDARGAPGGLCPSANATNILTWAHCADAHTGSLPETHADSLLSQGAKDRLL